MLMVAEIPYWRLRKKSIEGIIQEKSSRVKKTDIDSKVI